jgi:rhodanese-related sulfurtransferase
MDKVLDRVQGLEPYKFHAIANETGAVILDTRDAQDFAQGFIPNSINISIDGNFAIWVGTLVRDVKQEILVVANVGREEEVVTRLARVGFDYTLGFLDGGFESWKNEGREVDKIPILKPEELANMRDKGKKINILDVRKKSEYISEHIIGAKNVPLDYINETMSRIQRTTTYYVHCEGGYRSMVFNSILRARGFKNMVDVQGGFIAMKKSGQFQISDYECPTTLL